MFLEASLNGMVILLDVDLTTLAGCSVNVRSLQHCRSLQGEGNWKFSSVGGQQTVYCA
jgi:hypothetical protein